MIAIHVRSLLLALPGALAIALASGCDARDATPAPAAAPGPSSAPVPWVAARPPAATALLEAPARVVPAPDGRAVITPPLRARILAVRTQVGSTVEANAPLLDVALPEAAAAAAAYLAASDELAAHERRASQLEGLRAEGLARVGDLASIQLEIAQLRGAREIAATTLRAAGVPLAHAKGLAASGGRTTLRAPVAGVVIAMNAVLGASHAPEETLVELAAGAASRIEARLPRPLPAGARVEFVPIGGEAIAAKVVTVAPTRDADGSTRVWLDLDAPAPAGALGRIRGTLPETAAVAIPTGALGRASDGAFVWKRDGDRPTRTPVRVIATSGAEALVEGIALGDEVAALASAIAEPAPPEAP